MLKIRLERVGRKHEPAFRLVLTDSKNAAKSGRFKEILGSYDPRKNTDLIRSTDRVKHWLAKGAQLSDSVHNLLVTHKVIDAEKKNVLPKKTYEKPAEPEAAPAPVAETAAAAEAPQNEEPVAAVAETPVEEVAEVVEAPAEVPADTVEAPVESASETPAE